MTRTDAELIQMLATTDDALVEWRAEIFYSSAEGQGSIVVGDGGKPFRVSTELGEYRLPVRARKGGQGTSLGQEWHLCLLVSA